LDYAYTFSGHRKRLAQLVVAIESNEDLVAIAPATARELRGEIDRIDRLIDSGPPGVQAATAPAAEPTAETPEIVATTWVAADFGGERPRFLTANRVRPGRLSVTLDPGRARFASREAAELALSEWSIEGNFAGSDPSEWGVFEMRTRKTFTPVSVASEGAP
jgi:hypothetical protein